MKFSAVFRDVRNWHEANVASKRLSRLSDRDLADIGLSRMDVDPGLTGDAERRRRNCRYGSW